jgi:hypothetical protein
MSESMTVREIVLDYLRRVGADGLCGDHCSCPLDDLMGDCGMGGPCGADCVPAKLSGDEDILVEKECEA